MKNYESFILCQNKLSYFCQQNFGETCKKVTWQAFSIEKNKIRQYELILKQCRIHTALVQLYVELVAYKLVSYKKEQA